MTVFVCVGVGEHTIQVHLHHDHWLHGLVCDPDDPWSSRRLALLISSIGLWGWGLALALLI